MQTFLFYAFLSFQYILCKTRAEDLEKFFEILQFDFDISLNEVENEMTRGEKIISS